MALRKSPKVDLRMKYSRYLEISFIISLAFLIAAFKFFPKFDGKGKQIESSQKLFTVEDIQQTKQENRPPPLYLRFQLNRHLMMNWMTLK